MLATRKKFDFLNIILAANQYLVLRLILESLFSVSRIKKDVEAKVTELQLIKLVGFENH